MGAAVSAEVYSLLHRRPAWAMAEAKGGLLASVYPVNWDSTDGQNGTEPCTGLHCWHDRSANAHATDSPRRNDTLPTGWPAQRRGPDAKKQSQMRMGRWQMCDVR